MSSSQKSYRIVLQEDHMLASIHGFRQVDEDGKRYQERLLSSDKQIEEIKGEMWARGFKVSIEEVENGRSI